MRARYPYRSAWSGRLLALLFLLAPAVPISVAVLLLTEFSILTDNDDAEEPSSSFVAGAAAGAAERIQPSFTLTADEEEPAAAEPTEEEEQESGPQVHVVIAGDTLAALAQRYGTTVAALAAFNTLADPNALRLGQQLRIPPPDFVPAEPPAAEPEEGAAEEPEAGAAESLPAAPEEEESAPP